MDDIEQLKLVRSFDCSSVRYFTFFILLSMGYEKLHCSVECNDYVKLCFCKKKLISTYTEKYAKT